MHTHSREMHQRRCQTLARTVILSAPFGLVLAPEAGASPVQGVERRWGGETRQVFELDEHVWTVGDGGHIRYALDPQDGDDWTVQSPPAGVTQTLLDVYFLDEDRGWACGAAGEVIYTTNGGTTWLPFDTGRVQNGLSPSEDALLWRVRFLDYPYSHQPYGHPQGFVCGLWTFKYWNGSSWQDVVLDQGSKDENVFEFYALDFVVNPSNPAEWFGVAAGQEWNTAGGGTEKVGRIYFTSSRALDAGTYDYGKKWVQKHSTFTFTNNHQMNDPWDFEFAPNPSDLDNAVGYLSSGTGTDNGAVFRTATGGQSWSTDLENPAPPSDLEVNTLYGITAIDNDQALAVGYGGHIWYRDAQGWSEVGPNSPCSVPCDWWTGPLAGTNAADDGTVYAVGSWGFLHKSSSSDWSSHTDLNTITYQSPNDAPRFSESIDEHWRLEASYFLDIDNGFAVGARKLIAESITGGNDFDKVIGGPLTAGVIAQFLDIDFNPDGDSGVAVGQTQDPALTGSLTLANALSYYYDSGTWQPGAHPPSLVNQGFTAIELRGVAFKTNPSSSTEVWAVGNANDSQDQQPLLLRSTDGGQTWDDENPTATGTIPNGVILTGVDFAASLGFCVGYDEDTGAARAYVFRDPGTGVLISDRSPTSGGALRAVATNGSFAYAVGDDEQILKFQPGVSTLFADVGAPTLLGGLDLLSVDIAANGFVLVGADQEYEEPLSLHMGKLIYFDGSGWGTTPSGTNKSIHSVFLRDDDEGWLVSLGTDGSSEFGNVGESVVGHFSGLP